MADGGDRKAWASSDVKDAVSKSTAIADGGYLGTSLAIAHRRERGQAELSAQGEEHNRPHRKASSRVEQVFARLQGWKIRRRCRPPR
ncbi:transposase family protein [Streptomyces mirabilis]|uniref:transposase family protein n=1 Tax=Streptomyces mirabilis TaxID=68239 RepID=UPI0036C50E7E